MSDDRTLLEMAAKAAGYYFHGHRMGRDPAGRDYKNCYVSTTNDPDDWFVWSPLTDDGDALRLAHKIKASIQCRDGCEGPGHFGFFSWVEVRLGGRPQTFKEFHAQNADAETATRRAIVRAAAAIGEQHGP